MYQSWNAFQTFLVKDNCLPTFGATDAILNIARVSHNNLVYVVLCSEKLGNYSAFSGRTHANQAANQRTPCTS